MTATERLHTQDNKLNEMELSLSNLEAAVANLKDGLVEFKDLETTVNNLKDELQEFKDAFKIHASEDKVSYTKISDDLNELKIRIISDNSEIKAALAHQKGLTGGVMLALSSLGAFFTLFKDQLLGLVK